MSWKPDVDSIVSVPNKGGDYSSWVCFMAMGFLIRSNVPWEKVTSKAGGSCTCYCESHLFTPGLLPGRLKGLPPAH